MEKEKSKPEQMVWGETCGTDTERPAADDLAFEL